MTGFCDVTYDLAADSALGPCVNDIDLTTSLVFDLFCTGAADLATAVGTLSQKSYTLTWTAELTSPYSVDGSGDSVVIDTKSETFDI